MKNNKRIKKVENHALREVIAILFLFTQILPYPSVVYGADPISVEEPYTPVVSITGTGVNSTTTTISQTNTGSDFLTPSNPLSPVSPDALTSPSSTFTRTDIVSLSNNSGVTQVSSAEDQNGVTANRRGATLYASSYTSISPSSTLTAADIIPLPGNPGIARVAPEGNLSEIAMTPRGVTIHYDTNIGGWAGGGFTFEDFSTFEIETVDLSGFSQLVFGLKGDTDQVKFEIVDDQDRKASVRLTGIRADQEQVWGISSSFFEGVDLARTRIIYFIIEGENQFGVLEINRIPVSPLPEGWSRVPSNPNFARKIEYRGAYIDAKLMDLKTGAVLTLGTASSNRGYSVGIADVSPDGRAAIVIYSGPTSAVYVKNLKYPSFDGLRIDGEFQSVHFENGYAIIQTSLQIYRLDLSTFDLPPIPEGWTRAPSNPNYAFRVEDNPLGGEDLKLMDLRTGQIQLLQEQANPDSIVGLRDVSPDNFPEGPIAISQIGYRPFGANSSPAYTTSIQRIQNPSERELISSGYGELLEISFEEDQALLRFGDKFFGPDAVEDIYSVKGSPSLQVTYDHSRLVATPENVHVDSDTPLVIRKQIEYTGSGSEFVILIYDSSEGLDRLHKLLEQRLTIDSGGYYTFSDAYTTPNGKQIVSIGLDTDHSNITVIVDARTGEEIRLEGATTGVTYENEVAAYKLVKQDGTRGEMKVNLETFEIIPFLPEGWTRATSNPNYAFIEEPADPHCGRAGCPWVLKLVDLRTGNQQILWTAFIGAGYRIGRVRDVSSDETPGGHVVIFEKDGMDEGYPQVVLQRVHNPNERLVLFPPQGPFGNDDRLEKIEFFKAFAILTMKDGAKYFVDLVRLQEIPVEIYHAVLNFYGGALPKGATIIFLKGFFGSRGEKVWKAAIDINQTHTRGTIQNQVLEFKEVGGSIRLEKVLERDIEDTIVMESQFLYSVKGVLEHIIRYDGTGNYISTIFHKEFRGLRKYYYVIRTRTGKSRILGEGSMSLYKLLMKARYFEVRPKFF